MNRVPYHVAAGDYGAQQAFQTATPPEITAGEVTVTTFSQLETEMATPGRRITIGANIVTGSNAGDYPGSTFTDLEIVVPNGILVNMGPFGSSFHGTVSNRIRFTKATGDSIGGQVHNMAVAGSAASDIVCDGLQLSADLSSPGPPFYIAANTVARHALLRNRIRSQHAGYGYGVPHLLIAGNSMFHDANNADNSGDWGYRINSGPTIFFENDTRGNNYAPLRFHPRDGSALQYAWCSDNTFVNNDTTVAARTFDCHDTLGTELYPNRIDAVWMLDSRFYLESASFLQLHTRNLGGPTVSYFRINGNEVFGDVGPFADGGAPDGDVTGNTYNAALGTVPAWGAAGDPTGINLSP
jgi:hypothetical protein